MSNIKLGAKPELATREELVRHGLYRESLKQAFDTNPCPRQFSHLAKGPMVHWRPGERERVLELRQAALGCEEADRKLEELAAQINESGGPEIPLHVLISASSRVFLPLWNRHGDHFISAAVRDDGVQEIDGTDVLWLLARHGEEMLPGLLLRQKWGRWRSTGAKRYPALHHLESAEVAVEMAELAWTGAHPLPKGVPVSRTGRVSDASPEWRLGRAWLNRYQETAVHGLLPLALSSEDSRARAFAWSGLEVIADDASVSALMLEIANRQGEEAEATVRAYLERRSSSGANLPNGRLPKTWRPSAHPRPVLADSGHALPDDIIRVLVEAMMRSSNVWQDPLIKRVKTCCTRESLGAFAWGLFSAYPFVQVPRWRRKGSDATRYHEWMYACLAYFGDEHCARKLAPMIRQWPRASYIVRAIRGLEILADIGTDAALGELQALSSSNGSLGSHASAVLDTLAIERGLTREQLVDLAVPHLGLNQDGELNLDIGGPRCSVSIDEQFIPKVRIGPDQLIPNWPKIIPGAEPALVAEALSNWKIFRKELRSVSRQQSKRLEEAMLGSRRWKLKDFLAGYVRHPLLKAPVRGLVWACHEASADRPVLLFSIDTGEVFRDIDGHEIVLPENGLIGIPHPLEFGEGLSDWRDRWKSLRRGQPIVQLTRKVFRREFDAEGTLFGLQGASIPSAAFRGLTTQGWIREMAGVAGWIEGFSRRFKHGLVSISIEPGLHIDTPDWDGEQQKLSVGQLPELSDIEFSELARELMSLRQ